MRKRAVHFQQHRAAGSSLPACRGFVSQHGPAVSPSVPPWLPGPPQGRVGSSGETSSPGTRARSPACAGTHPHQLLGRHPGPHRAPGGGCVRQGSPSLAQHPSQPGNPPHLLHVAWGGRYPDNQQQRVGETSFYKESQLSFAQRSSEGPPLLSSPLQPHECWGKPAQAPAVRLQQETQGMKYLLKFWNQEKTCLIYTSGY